MTFPLVFRVLRDVYELLQECSELSCLLSTSLLLAILLRVNTLLQRNLAFLLFVVLFLSRRILLACTGARASRKFEAG